MNRWSGCVKDHLAGLNVVTATEGFPDPNAFGYLVLALAVWVLSLTLALIMERTREG
jgi:hypothetical protein